MYQAEDTQTSTKVALKTLRVDLYEREDLVKRFEREARAAGRIGHPSIVGVHAVGHDDALRTRFIVQEELRGTDVAGCLNELGSLSPLSAMAVALPVMDALIAAHAAGIVHRDIKPENVFLHEMDDGTIVPKVIDFGIAKVIDELDRMERTATGMVFGTPWYMSPEQALGDSSIDARTDVWSVGAMIYEMVCGTLPFGGTNPNAVMAQIIFGRPTPLQHHWPDVPADLQEVIHKAIERDLDKRYATMREFRDALVGCALWRDVTPGDRPGLPAEAELLRGHQRHPPGGVHGRPGRPPPLAAAVAAERRGPPPARVRALRPPARGVHREPAGHPHDRRAPRRARDAQREALPRRGAHPDPADARGPRRRRPPDVQRGGDRHRAPAVGAPHARPAAPGRPAQPREPAAPPGGVRHPPAVELGPAVGRRASCRASAWRSRSSAAPSWPSGWCTGSSGRSRGCSPPRRRRTPPPRRWASRRAPRRPSGSSRGRSRRCAPPGVSARSIAASLAVPPVPSRGSDRSLERAMNNHKVGDHIDDRYELKRQLGESAVCTLFEAVHRYTGRRVVMKLLRGSDGTPDETEAMLLRDAFALGRIRHPYLVELLDAGIFQSVPYVVTALLEGRSLEGLLAARGTLTPDETATVGRQIALALEALHRNGLLHGDVSPANVWIVRSPLGDEQVVLRNLQMTYEPRKAVPLEGPRRRSGSFVYQAPESTQNGRVVDPRSDLFSLGVLLFECLIGRPPKGLASERSDGEFPSLRVLRPELPGALTFAIERCLRSSTSERFSCARDLVGSLEATHIAFTPMRFLSGSSAHGLRAITPLLDAPARRPRCGPHARRRQPAAAPPAVLVEQPSGVSRRKVARAAYATPVRIIGHHGVMEGASRTSPPAACSSSRPGPWRSGWSCR
ncbi:MAG: protein kinase [Deltaproteobacteria bacterium]|nr:protein kinase [Deltaproteobacteria bacterium]